MPANADAQWQDFSTVQSLQQQKPQTIASAATIAPVSFLTILTGNTAVVTITPPLTGLHTLAIQFAGVAGVTAAGNILTATASVAGQIMLLVYNPLTGKYIPIG